MKNKSFAMFVVLAAMLLSSQGVLQAQHADIEFGYDDAANPSGIIIDNNARTIENTMIVSTSFEVLDPFDPGNFGSDQPGFATNASEDLIFNAGDRLWIEVLDASEHSIFGAGFVNFCDSSSSQLQASGRLTFADNSIGTADLILDGDMIESGDNPGFIDVASSNGSLHDHIVIDLMDDLTAPFGAYGVFCQLHTDLDADGECDVSSEAFWIVWNHGLSSAEFDSALKHFGFGLAETSSDSFVARRGVLDSGGLSETQQSDDSYLIYRPGFTLNNTEPPVWLEFETALADPATSILVVALEDRASSFNLLRTIELMNWNTGSFEQVSSEDSPFNQDALVLLNVSAADFVQPGTGLVTTKVSWKADGFILSFPWTVSLDQLAWFTE